MATQNWNDKQAEQSKLNFLFFFVFFRFLFFFFLHWRCQQCFSVHHLAHHLEHDSYAEIQAYAAEVPSESNIIARCHQHRITTCCGSRRLQLSATKTELMRFGLSLALTSLLQSDMTMRRTSYSQWQQCTTSACICRQWTRLASSWLCSHDFSLTTS